MLVHVPRHHSTPVSGALELVVPHDSLWTPGMLQGWTTRVGTMPLRSTAGSVGARGSSTNYVSKPTEILGGPWTIIASFQFNAALTGNWIAGVCEAPGNATWDRQIGRQTSSLAVHAYDSASRIATVDTGPLTTDKIYNVVGTCDGSNVRAACNGVNGTSAAISNFGYTAYTSPEFCIGNSTNTQSVTSDHSVMLVALLPYAEPNYVELSANPWSIFKPHRSRIYSFPSGASSGTTVAVPKASLVLTGRTPTVSVTNNVTVSVPKGSLILSGKTPVVIASDHKIVSVPKGSLVLTGKAPTVTVSAGTTIFVPKVSLTLTGYAPNVLVPQVVQVPKGGMVLTGYAPNVLTPVTVLVSKGTLTITGRAPTIVVTSNKLIEVPKGALILRGYAPTVLGTVVAATNRGSYSEPDRRLRERLRKLAIQQAYIEDDEEALAILLATIMRKYR